MPRVTQLLSDGAEISSQVPAHTLNHYRSLSHQLTAPCFASLTTLLCFLLSEDSLVTNVFLPQLLGKSSQH